MKKNLFYVPATLAFSLLILSGCTIAVKNPDTTSSSSGSSTGGNTTGNHAPVVTLTSATTGGTIQSTFYSDQPFTVTVNATDADNDPLTYTWYNGSTLLNGSGNITSQTTSVKFNLLASTTSNRTISVIVSDGKESISQFKSVSLTPAASCRIVNNSSYTVQKVYFKPWTAELAEAIKVDTFSYTNDLSGTIEPGVSWSVWSIDAGYYNARYDSTKYMGWWTYVLFSNGVRRIFTLNDTANDTLENIRDSGVPSSPLDSMNSRVHIDCAEDNTDLYSAYDNAGDSIDTGL